MAREGKAPAFPFYAADWLADMDLATMTLAQKGAYVDLLCYQWREGHLPDDTNRLAMMLRVTRKEFDRIWPAIASMFPKSDDGTLKNARMEKERQDMESHRASQAEAGRRGAAKRWGGHSEPIAVANGVPIDSPLTKNSSASASASASARSEVSIRARVDSKKLQDAWLAATGNIGTGVLSELASRCEDHAPLVAIEPTEYAVRFCAVFVQWSKTCPPGKGPPLSPLKALEHFERIHEIISGKRSIGDKGYSNFAAPRAHIAETHDEEL